jgi:L-cysteine S-thiosulfotransferase
MLRALVTALAIGLATGSPLIGWAAQARAETLPALVVAGDAIPRSLTGRPGDRTRGREIAARREYGNCLLCHRMPIPGEPFQGTIGPDLSGVAARLSEGQIRLRIVDASRVNPRTIMPPYYRVEGLRRVMAAYRDRPILNADQVEDAVALLMTFR